MAREVPWNKLILEEFIKEEPTFAMCQKLASLYIVRDHFSGDYVEGSNID